VVVVLVGEEIASEVEVVVGEEIASEVEVVVISSHKIRHYSNVRSCKKYTCSTHFHYKYCKLKSMNYNRPIFCTGCSPITCSPIIVTTRTAILPR